MEVLRKVIERQQQNIEALKKIEQVLRKEVHKVDLVGRKAWPLAQLKLVQKVELGAKEAAIVELNACHRAELTEKQASSTKVNNQRYRFCWLLSLELPHLEKLIDLVYVFDVANKESPTSSAPVFEIPVRSLQEEGSLVFPMRVYRRWLLDAIFI